MRTKGDKEDQIFRSVAETLEPDCQGSNAGSTPLRLHDLGQVTQSQFSLVSSFGNVDNNQIVWRLS